MKKVLLLVAFLGMMFSANAQTKQKYIVTVQVQIVYTYYDGNREVGEDTAMGDTYNIPRYAETPNEAEEDALSECSTMCRTSYRKEEGMREYKGKMYICKSYKRPFRATAKLAN
mgnify:CR=1 FL=1